jgi:hypothetical protein
LLQYESVVVGNHCDNLNSLLCVNIVNV